MLKVKKLIKLSIFDLFFVRNNQNSLLLLAFGIQQRLEVKYKLLKYFSEAKRILNSLQEEAMKSILRIEVSRDSFI